VNPSSAESDATPMLGGDPIDADLRDFYEASFATLLTASPEVAAEIGVVEVGGRSIPQDRFSDVSPAGEEQRCKLMAATLQALRDRPGPAADLDRAIYEFFLRWGNFGHLRGTESHSFALCDSVADHLAGAQTELVTCLTQWQRLSTDADVDAFLSRLAAVPRHIDGLMEGLRERQAVGNIMPACIVARDFMKKSL
jgi:uncharacterized protein (DUF885 family)